MILLTKIKIRFGDGKSFIRKMSKEFSSHDELWEYKKLVRMSHPTAVSINFDYEEDI